MLNLLREWLTELRFTGPYLLYLSNDLYFVSLCFGLDFLILNLKLLDSKYQSLQIALHQPVLILEYLAFLDQSHLFINCLHIEQL